MYVLTYLQMYSDPEHDQTLAQYCMHCTIYNFQRGLSKNLKTHVRETNNESMSRKRQTKKEMFEFSTKTSESLTLSDMAR